MIGFGTIINVVGILLGGLAGILWGRLISENLQDTLMKSNGIAVIILGISGTLTEMLYINNGEIAARGAMMMILSLASGSFLGELINLDLRIEQFGKWLKIKTRNAADPYFIDGFVTASLTVCIGAMAIVGALQDGLTGDYSTLLTKSILDFIVICIMTASMGKGCIFSVIPVALLQGGVTLLAGIIEPLMTEDALNNLSFVGNILILCVGINLVWKNTKIKVANMLPSIIAAVLFSYLPW